MRTIAILGAGDLAATAARRLAELELARRIVLVDANEGRAKGKALDIAQSGPVEHFDVQLEGCADLNGAGTFDVLLIADPPALEDPVLSSSRAAEFVGAWAPAIGERIVVVAGASPSAVVEAAIARGLRRDRVLGSAPVALAAALRRRLATELDSEPREVSAIVLGLPPAHLLLPQGAATMGGVPVERFSPVAARRALAAVTGRAPGPVALAAAAVRVLQALAGSRASVLPVVAGLAGEYAHRGVALAVPARIASGRLLAVIEVPLEPVDRVAFDNAASRRSAATR